MAVEKTYMLRLKAKVGADRRLVIELPPEMPTGEVELTVLSKQPEGAVALTPEERMEIGKLPPDARPSEELIDEDRGEY